MTNLLQLGGQLRHVGGDFLEQRCGIVVSSLTALGSMGLIALYHLSNIKHLPEPPWPGLNADKADASDDAYSHRESATLSSGWAAIRS